VIALEDALKLSLVQVQLYQIASTLNPRAARIVRASATMLHIVRTLDEDRFDEPANDNGSRVEESS
jgi:hypothetical protein